jgi:uncharacterized repeat protein (TIGR01451 family)
LSSAQTLDGDIVLDWPDTGNATAEYRIERSTTAQPWTEIAAIPGDQPDYSDATVTCETTYNYRVRRYRALDDSYSAYSTETSITTRSCDYADLELASAVTAVEVERTEQIIFTHTISNTGTVTAQGIELVHPLIEGLSFISANHGGCVAATDEVICQLADLAPGAGIAVEVAMIVQFAEGELTQQAEVSTTTYEFDFRDNSSATVISAIRYEHTATISENALFNAFADAITAAPDGEIDFVLIDIVDGIEGAESGLALTTRTRDGVVHRSLVTMQFEHGLVAMQLSSTEEGVTIPGHLQGEILRLLGRSLDQMIGDYSVILSVEIRNNHLHIDYYR